MPKKQPGQQPGRFLSIRLSADELRAVYRHYEKSTCRSLTEYARKVLTNKPVMIKVRNQSQDELLLEMIAIKNTLGQILSRPGSSGSFDGHGFFHIDPTSNTVCRDTELGPGYTAAAMLERCGLGAELHTLAAGRQPTVTAKERSFLELSDPDPGGRLRLLLSLTRQHDKWMERRLE